MIEKKVLTFVNVRIANGTEKRVPISKLTPKQLNFQLSNIDKVVPNLESKLALLRNSNLKLSRVRKNKETAQQQILENTAELMKVEKTYSFLLDLKDALVQEKDKREGLLSFKNAEASLLEAIENEMALEII